MEIVFDKGIDAVNSCYLHFLLELIKRIENFIETNKEEFLFDLLREKIQVVYKRVNSEMDSSLKYLNSNRMNYNDFRFSKLAAHFLFVSKLSKYSKQTDEFEVIMKKIEENSHNFNCFIQSFLI